MIKPISPNEVELEKPKQIHPGIIEAVNILLKKEYVNGRAKIRQDDILAEFYKKNTYPTRAELFHDHHMDFEVVYSQVGWKVTYDKPGYNETGDCYYIFERKRT